MAENILLTIPTPRLDGSLAFYTNALRCSLRKRMDRQKGRKSISFVAGAL